MRILIASLLLFVAAANAPAQQTVALLVGHSGYAEHPHPTAQADVAAMKKTLESMGVKVAVLEDVKERGKLNDAVNAFGARVPTKGTAIFYFAGYGATAEVKKRVGKKDEKWTGNHLMPIDPRYKGGADFGRYSAKLPDVLQGLEYGGASKVLVILNTAKHPTAKKNQPPVPLKHIDAKRFELMIAQRPSAAEIKAKLAIGDTSRIVAKPTDGKKPGDVWISSLGVSFCWIPPGKFTMGSPKGHALASDDEAAVPVTIAKGFWMAKYEMTQREMELGARGKREGNPPLPANLPYDCVKYGSKYRDFIKRQTEADRKSGAIPSNWAYALPTEAEWEYAARAGSSTLFFFGDAVAGLAKHGNFADKSLYDSDDSIYRYADKSLNDGYATLAPVGSYKPNSWGLHDMYGNVWEWCADHYKPQLPGGTDPLSRYEKDAPFGQVARGGSFISQPDYCRSAFRQGMYESKAPWFGVRIVVKEVPPAPKNTSKKK